MVHRVSCSLNRPRWLLAAALSLGTAGCTTVQAPLACADCEPATTQSTTAPSPRTAAENRAQAALAKLPALAGETGAEGAHIARRNAGQSPSTMADAVAIAISDNPKIGLAKARYDEAKAAVGQAKAPGLPQFDVSVGAGPGVLGNYQSGIGPYWDPKNAQGAARVETLAGFRQLLFNFGATSADVARAVQQMDAEGLRTVARTEEIAYGTAMAYSGVLRQRELVQLATENLAALQRIARLVEENERNGNATVADVKRVRARVIDAESGKADQEYELHLASDRFRRLTRAEPGRLRPAPVLSARVPPSKEAALAEARQSNPALLAQKAAIIAARREIDSLKAGGMPSLSLDGSASNKHFNGNTKTSEIDVRALVTVRYKFLDGGLQSSQVEQAAARLVAQEKRLQSEEEDVEDDLRKFYWQLGTTASKASGLDDGVAASATARELYEEQFRGGKRSLLELLEVQNSYYVARRSKIQNTYERIEAGYGVLRALGRFVRTSLAAR